MPDTLTKKQRSKCMSLIRSKWTLPERKMHNYLKGSKVKHKMHPKLPGNPDVLLVRSKTAIFLQGCFWHKHKGCKYFVVPKTRTEWWRSKINKTVLRDTKNRKKIKQLGWETFVVWECELKTDKREERLNSLYERIKCQNLITYL